MDQIATFKTKRGKEVVVRVPRIADLDEQLKFINNLAEEDTFILRGPEDKATKEEEEKWLKDFLEKVKKDEAILLSAFISQRLVANASLEKRKWRQKHVGNVGISVAKPFRGQGIGQKLLEILMDKARKRGYKILVLNVFANNERAIHIYEKLGFKKTGVLPKAVLYKGKYVDEITMYKEP